MAADTLHDFFVGVGFKLDEASRAKVEDQVERVQERATKAAANENTKRSHLEDSSADRRERKAVDLDKRERQRRAENFKDLTKHVNQTEAALDKVVSGFASIGTVFAGSALFRSIAGTAQAYSRLAMEAQRTLAAPSQISALVYGLGQMGVDRGEADSSFQGFSQALQKQPGLRSLLSKTVRTKEADGSDRNAAGIFGDLGAYFNSLPRNVAMQMAGSMGIGTDTMLALQKEEQLKAKIAEYGKISGSFGLDPDKAAKEGREFTAAYDKLATDLHAIKDKVEAEFFNPLTGHLTGLSKLLEDHGADITKFAVPAFEGFAALLSLKLIPQLVRAVGLLGRLVNIPFLPPWLMAVVGLTALNLTEHAHTGAAEESAGHALGAEPSEQGRALDKMSAGERTKALARMGWNGVKRLFGGGDTPDQKAQGGGSSDGNPGGGKAGGTGKPGGWWTPEQQKHAYDRLVAGGMPPVSAVALISRWKNVESHNRGPDDANNIGGGHVGIAQWDRKRWARVGGDKGVDAQLDAVLEEFRTGSGDGAYVKASEALKNAKTDQDAAIGASAYERAEGYSANRDGTDNFTGATLGGMAEVRRNVLPKPPTPSRIPGPGDRGYVPPIPKIAPLPGTVNPRPLGDTPALHQSFNTRGDTSFHQHVAMNVTGHADPDAVAGAVKASARRGGQDYIRFIEGSTV